MGVRAMLGVIFIKLVMISTLFGAQAQGAEIVEGSFQSGGKTFTFEGVSTFKYPFLKLEKKPVLLVTHSSFYWDRNHATWPATESLVSGFKKSKLPVKYLAAIEERSDANDTMLKLENKYFPKGISKTDLHPFQGDSHRIVVTGSNVVIAGGNFTICACNTVRSIIALAESVLPLHIHYAMDAIYEGQDGKLLLLQEISSKLNDVEFLNYLVENYFHEDTLPCKEASLFTKQKFSYDIYRDKKFIGHIGGKDNRVVLSFDTSAGIIQQLIR